MTTQLLPRKKKALPLKEKAKEIPEGYSKGLPCPRCGGWLYSAYRAGQEYFLYGKLKCFNCGRLFEVIEKKITQIPPREETLPYLEEWKNLFKTGRVKK